MLASSARTFPANVRLSAKSGPVTVANSGAGSIWEAATVGLGDAADAEFTPVPYDGGATAVAAAASGETVAAVSGLGEALAQGEAVRILGESVNFSRLGQLSLRGGIPPQPTGAPPTTVAAAATPSH